MARDLPLTAKLQAILRDRTVQAWLLDNCAGGFAPAWRDAKLVVRFDREEDAELFLAEYHERLGG